MGMALRKLTRLLSERGLYFETSEPHPYRPTTVRWVNRDGTREYHARSSGNDEVVFHGTVPVEGAVMAMLGPDRKLEDEFPMGQTRMSFGGTSFSVPCDGEHVLLTMEQARFISDDFKRLYDKSQNQRRELRRLHGRAMAQSGEIDRVQRDLMEMLLREAGYSEGESVSSDDD